MRIDTQIELAELTAKADAAFRLAGEKVIDRAKRYKTSVVVWKDNDVHEIPYEQLDSIDLGRAAESPISHHD
ncbi:MAG: hypothetical protein DCC68_06060 [Planctomycetota bacterium]|nr:MAG: hypothetical protein DCC68_06060 [Planctomycetota bacterium]